jgi:endo-1,4-beta-xylanase
MTKKLKKILVTLATIVIFGECGKNQTTSINKPVVVPKAETLKEAFKNEFRIGAALGTEHILEASKTANDLISNQFNAITPENVMKAEAIHPEKNKYNFELADKFVALGQKNKQYITGHALVWHSQLTKYAEGLTKKEDMRVFLTEHINTVAGRYAGKLDSWDVVNEALNDDGTMRESIFYKLMGDSYIKEAFELAAKADPKAALYYNDYNIEQPKKRAGAIALIKKLKDAGVKIDGVGIQGHWGLFGAPVSEIEESIIEFSKLGVKVAFTELDITVLPNPWELTGADVKQNYDDYVGDPKMNPYSTALPQSVQTQLAKRYEDIFRVFLKHKDKISRVTFWGVNDGHSWLNDWPIKKRTNYPLLFDRNFKPKPAFYSVINLKK